MHLHVNIFISGSNVSLDTMVHSSSLLPRRSAYHKTPDHQRTVWVGEAYRGTVTMSFFQGCFLVHWGIDLSLGFENLRSHAWCLRSFNNSGSDRNLVSVKAAFECPWVVSTGSYRGHTDLLRGVIWVLISKLWLLSYWMVRTAANCNVKFCWNRTSISLSSIVFELIF